MHVANNCTTVAFRFRWAIQKHLTIGYNTKNASCGKHRVDGKNWLAKSNVVGNGATDENLVHFAKFTLVLDKRIVEQKRLGVGCFYVLR